MRKVIIGFEDTIWMGLWAPAGVSAGVAGKLTKDAARELESPDVNEQLVKLGEEPMSMTSAEFSKFVQGEMESAARIVKAAGIKQQ